MTDRATRTDDLALPGLKGQRVFVTAGASGIGREIAGLLHRLGAQVALCDVAPDALAAAKDALTGCLTLQADVTDEDAVAHAFEQAASRFGGLDALINNAGIAGPTAGVAEISAADWRRCIDVCLTGQFLCARAAVPLIRSAGGGSIVNMSSAAGKHGYAFRSPYSAAKFGVIGLTQSLAKELGPENIRVNAILPGFVAGPRMEKVIAATAEAEGLSLPDMRARYLGSVSLRRMVDTGDVAATVAFLLSDAGKNLSGQSLAVDGNVETL